MKKLIVFLALTASFAAFADEAGPSLFNPAICQGAPMTTQDAGRFFAPGATTAITGSYHIYGRARTCTQVSGCSEWQAAAVYGVRGNRIHEISREHTFQLVLSSSASAPFFTGAVSDGSTDDWFDLGPAQSAAYDTLLDRIQLGVETVAPSNGDTALVVGNSLTGTLAAGCGWFKLSKTVASTLDGETQTSEIVVYGTQ